MHRRVIRWLVDRYDVILLPHFEVQQMVMAVNPTTGKRRRIRQKTVKDLHAIKFYEFSQRLKHRAEEEGVVVVRVNEAYTSRTCGHCGLDNATLGGKKRFDCGRCGLSADRDLNGARNIFLRFLELMGE